MGYKEDREKLKVITRYLKELYGIPFYFRKTMHEGTYFIGYMDLMERRVDLFMVGYEEETGEVKVGKDKYILDGNKDESMCVFKDKAEEHISRRYLDNMRVLFNKEDELVEYGFSRSSGINLFSYDRIVIGMRSNVFIYPTREGVCVSLEHRYEKTYSPDQVNEVDWVKSIGDKIAAYERYQDEFTRLQDEFMGKLQEIDYEAKTELFSGD